jgi:hypothetical protein
MALAVMPFQSVFANSVQAQPLCGFSWPTHGIPVAIDASQPDAAQAVSKAMVTWNLAQQWFIATYMAGSGTPFVFYETSSTTESMVTVTFNQTQSIDDLGKTNWQEFHDQQGFFKRIIVNISIDLTTQTGRILSDADLQMLATHELGHAIGLDHTTFSTADLMNHMPEVLFPSTLNLHAVYLLSQSSNTKDLPKEPVTLPDNIPYMMVTQAELNSVTPPTVQTVSSSSSPLMTQLASAITYGPLLYIAVLAVLASVIVGLALRGRKSDSIRTVEAEAVFHDTPILEEQPQQSKETGKKCRYCGTEVSRENLICPKCGMPAYT